MGLLFGGGYLSQFVRNYQQWKDAGGTPGDGSSPTAPVLSFSSCCEALFSKSGLIGVGLCLLLLGLLIVMVMRMGYQKTTLSQHQISESPNNAGR